MANNTIQFVINRLDLRTDLIFVLMIFGGKTLYCPTVTDVLGGDFSPSGFRDISLICLRYIIYLFWGF